MYVECSACMCDCAPSTFGSQKRASNPLDVTGVTHGVSQQVGAGNQIQFFGKAYSAFSCCIIFQPRPHHNLHSEKMTDNNSSLFQRETVRTTFQLVL